MKYKLTTTLKLLKEKNACKNGYEKLIHFLGKDYAEDKEINILTILESNGAEHCLWSLRATIEDSHSAGRLIAADCAESVLYIFKKKYPRDYRPEKAIAAARKLDLPKDEIITAADAAYDAAYAASDADADAAASAAGAAASAADAADSADAAADTAASADDASADDAAAAYAAADDAAYAASDASYKERLKQAEIIKKYLTY